MILFPLLDQEGGHSDGADIQSHSAVLRPTSGMVDEEIDCDESCNSCEDDEADCAPALEASDRQINRAWRRRS